MSVRVLMVDDEPDAEELFRQNFRREIRKGVYEFLFARSGAHALAVLEKEGAPGILVVLSDINMPGMTGLELLESIKARWPELPVIMITAYADRGEEARRRGAEGLFAKPVDFGGLKSTLADLSGAAA